MNFQAPFPPGLNHFGSHLILNQFRMFPLKIEWFRTLKVGSELESKKNGSVKATKFQETRKEAGTRTKVILMEKVSLSPLSHLNVSSYAVYNNVY